MRGRGEEEDGGHQDGEEVMTCLASVVREIEIVLFVAGLVLCLHCQGGRPRVLGEVIGVGLGGLEGERRGGLVVRGMLEGGCGSHSKL